MKNNRILFVHSAGHQGPQEGSGPLVAALRKALGDGCEVLCPIMPEPDNPSYRPWKERLAREIAAMDDGVLLVGHSLGGSVLLKYLSEERCDTAIAGLFLVATPYWGSADWQVNEFTLQQGWEAAIPAIPTIVLYHSRDDDTVPFAHLGLYAERLPQAVVRALDGRGHEFADGLPELVGDITDVLSRSANGMAESVAWELRGTTAALLQAVASFTQEQLNTAPYEGSWTAAQVAEHLLRSYSVAEVLFGTVGPAARPSDQWVEQLRSVFLDMETKMQSPDFVVPPEQFYDRESLLKALSARLARIQEAVERTDLSLLCLDFALPGSEHFTRLEWVYFVLFHTQRHIRQLASIHRAVADAVPSGAVPAGR